MATSIFFNGRLISVPGSYSEVDASGLESVGLSAAGIVAVLGTGEGGRPVSDITEPSQFLRANKPEKMRELFRSGDLREVAGMLFEPAKDSAIQGGAVEVVAMKVNPATKSYLTLDNAQGPALELESEDYGAFTEQIKVSIGTGTNKGKLVSVEFEDRVESQDDVGGDALFSLAYDAPSLGWSTITAQVVAGGSVECEATKVGIGGLDNQLGVTLAAPGAIEVVSANAADIGIPVSVYGLDGSGNPHIETLQLNGTTPVVGTQIWAAGDVLGAKYIGTCAGNVSVRPSGGGSDVFTLAAGTDQRRAITLCDGVYVSGSPLTLVSSGASVKDILVVGKSTTGAVIIEKITLAGVVPVVGVANFTLVTDLILGDYENAQAAVLSAQAAKTTPAVQNTLLKVVDFFNARFVDGSGGFIATLLTGRTSYPVTQLDVMTAAVNILDPALGEFYADLYAIIEYLNQSNTLIDATAATGASGGAPSNTATPIFMAGGSEGIALFADYQNALNLLKRTRVNSVVVLTPDPAVHAALDAHCAYMGGIGRSERDGFAGLMNTAMTDVATKDEIKAQIVDLNSRHLRAWAQAIERYNTAGERTEFTAPFGAAVLAGMQAGSSIGESLTHKYMNVLSIRQHSSWNPTDDAEELIQAGLVFAENIEGSGRRVVRNVTTHLTTNNLAFVEGSVNEAVNYSVYTFRGNMEYAVGRKGFAGTVNAGKSIAIGTLGLLVDETVLVAYRSLFIELIVDVMEVSVEMAPVIPINFVKNTIHLVTIQQAAA